MSPFQVLQIPSGADEREIKRAYARLVKLARPDEDATAFQRLREAYERCLDIVRGRAHSELGVVAGGGPRTETVSGGQDGGRRSMQRGESRLDSPPDSGDGNRQASPEDCFDVAVFVGELHEMLGQQDPRRMREWLYGQEALYSLQLKHALRPVVVGAVGQAPRIQSRQVLDVLLAFFGLDQLDQDGLADRVQVVLAERFAVERLDDAVRSFSAGGRSWLNRRIAAELAASKVNILRRALLMIVPMIPTRIRNLLVYLRQIDPALRHERLHPGSIAYWLQVSEPIELRRPRLVMVFSRVVIWNLFLFAWLVLILNDAELRLPRTAALWMAWSAGLWTAYAVVKLAWHRFNEMTVKRLWLIPEESSAVFLALVGFLLSAILGLSPWPALIGVGLGHLRMIEVLPTWQRAVSIVLSLGCAVAGGMWVVHLEDVIALEPRVKFFVVLIALPIAVAPLLRRVRYRPENASPWLLSQALVACVAFVAVLLV